MELMVRDGDYLPDQAGSYRRAEGSELLLQRVLWKLSIPRGSFPFLPELGSSLHLLCRCKPAQREGMARQYVAQALADEEELTVTGVTLDGDGGLEVALEWQGQGLTVYVETEGM